MACARAQRKVVRILLVASLATGMYGCGTVHTQMFYFSEGHANLFAHMGAPPNVIYGGTTMDAMMIGMGVSALAQGEGIGHNLLMLPLFLLDLPLCLAADTAILPLAIGEQIELATRERRRGAERRTEALRDPTE